MYNKIYKYFMVNNILISENSGFKKRDSTINQLLSITRERGPGVALLPLARATGVRLPAMSPKVHSAFHPYEVGKMSTSLLGSVDGYT